MGRKAPRKAPGLPRQVQAHGCLASTRRLSALRHPSIGGTRSDKTKPGRKKRAAGTRTAVWNGEIMRCVQSQLLYRSSPRRRGPMITGRWSWVPALRPLGGRRPGRQSLGSRAVKRTKESQVAGRSSAANRDLCAGFVADALERFAESLRTPSEPFPFVLRHVRLEHLDHAATADDARQRQRHAEVFLITADRNDRALVVEHHLGDTRRYNPDSVLARAVALDDGDVGVAHVFLGRLPQLVHALAARFEQCRHRNAADACGGPQEHLCGPVVANHLCFDMCRIHIEMLAQMNAKSLAVEICAGAQNRRAALSRDIRERVGRIGHDEQHCLGLRAHDLWHDIAKNFGVLVEQLEAALRVVAVGGAAGFFVYARGDQHNACALERVVVAIDDIDLVTQRRAVAHVGCDRLRGLAVAVDEHDLTRAAAVDGGHGAGAADIARSNNANLHGLLHACAVKAPLFRSFPARAWKELVLCTEASEKALTPLQRGLPRTGTTRAARLRRSNSRSSWRLPRRRGRRKSRASRASSRPAACCRRAARRAWPTA